MSLWGYPFSLKSLQCPKSYLIIQIPAWLGMPPSETALQLSGVTQWVPAWAAGMRTGCGMCRPRGTGVIACVSLLTCMLKHYMFLQILSLNYLKGI